MAGEIQGRGELPEFCDYIHEKYPELDEDLVTMIEDLIKRQREKAARIDSRGNHSSVSAPGLLKSRLGLEKGGDTYRRSSYTSTD